MTKKIEKPITKEEGEKIVNSILNFNGFIKLEPKKETLSKATSILIKNNMGYWDALIEATMVENEVFDILTENTKDFKGKKIKPVNPLQ